MTTTLDRDDEPTQVMGLVDTTHPIATTSVRAPSVVDLSVHRGPAEQADMGVVPLPTATTVVPPRIRVGGLSPSRESVASGDSMTRTPNRALGRAAARLDTPRTINAGTQDDVLSFWGSLAGSGALVWLLYFQILPFSGRVGFVFCWFFVFLMLYAGVTAIGNPGQVVIDRVVAAVVRAGAYIVFGTRAMEFPEKFTVDAVALLSLLKSTYLASVYVYDSHGRSVESTLLVSDIASQLSDNSAPLLRC